MPQRTEWSNPAGRTLDTSQILSDRIARRLSLTRTRKHSTVQVRALRAACPLAPAFRPTPKQVQADVARGYTLEDLQVDARYGFLTKAYLNTSGMEDQGWGFEVTNFEVLSESRKGT
jgi:hypothetical protein